MAKDKAGHGSERKATGYIKQSGQVHEVHIGPSKAGVAKNRGWKEAVQHHAPGWRPMVHESMSHAVKKIESHPGFVGWKAKN